MVGAYALFLALALVHGGSSSCEAHTSAVPMEQRLPDERFPNQEADPEVFVEVFPNPGLGTLHIIYTVLDTKRTSSCRSTGGNAGCVLRFVLGTRELMSFPLQDGSLSGELEIHWTTQVDIPTSIQLALEVKDATHAVLARGHTHFEYVSELAPALAMERVLETLSINDVSLHTNAERHSEVQRIDSEVLGCSTPRSKLRTFQLSNVLVRKGTLDVFLGEHSLNSIQNLAPSMQASFGDMYPERRAPLRVLSGPWDANKCSGVSDLRGNRTGTGEPALRTAFLLVGVGMGTVEHFAHFLWDFALNIFRLQSALEHQRREQNATNGKGIVLLQTESMAALLRDRPRRFYEVLSGALHVQWEALDDVQDGTCLRSVAVGFGALQSVRSSEVRGSALSAGSQPCQTFIRAFARRLVAPYVNAVPFMHAAERETEGRWAESARSKGRETLREQVVLVMSREGERWRRWLNEEEVVERWNEPGGRGEELRARAQRHVMHHVTFAQQVALVQAAQVLLTCNGAQASAMLLAPVGCTVINLYPARWTDQGFGLLQRLAMEAIGVRYWQVEVDGEEVVASAELSGLASMRDADIRIRWSRFEHLVSSALLHPFNLQQRHSSAECQRAVPDATVTDETDANRDACTVSLDLGEPSIEVVEAECRRLLSHFEAG